MSNFSDWIGYVCERNAAGTLPALADAKQVLDALGFAVSAQSSAAPVPPPPAQTAASNASPEAASPRGYTIVDKANGLVQFDGQESTGWAGYAFAFAGSLGDFDPTSQAANTIGINCGNEQFAEDHPQIGLLSWRAVRPCVQKHMPGAPDGTLQWVMDTSPESRALPYTLALPAKIKDPETALAHLRLANPPTGAPDPAKSPYSHHV